MTLDGLTADFKVWILIVGVFQFNTDIFAEFKQQQKMNMGITNFRAFIYCTIEAGNNP